LQTKAITLLSVNVAHFSAGNTQKATDVNYLQILNPAEVERMVVF
jgi:hypothetical protein